MKPEYKQKVYNMLEGIESRSKIIDGVIIGAKKIPFNDLRKIIEEQRKLVDNIRGFVDIS